jgi:tetratricopeptide (TPR) repeat protein
MENQILGVLKTHDSLFATEEFVKNMLSMNNLKNYLISEINDPYFKIINYFYQKDDLKNMKKYIKLLLENNEEYGLALLGFYYCSINKIEKANLIFKKGLDKNYDFVKYYYAWYQHQIGNYEEMKKYYLECIEKEDIYSMYGLGYYYNSIEDLKNMAKYYEMVIEIKDNQTHSISIDYILKCLIKYYENIDIKKTVKYYMASFILGDMSAICDCAIYLRFHQLYDEMKECLLLGVSVENSEAMFQLGEYYETIETDFENMEKYYKMAIEKDNVYAMTNIADYYKSIEKYDEMEIYYKMAIDKDDVAAMNNFGEYYRTIEDYDKMMYYWKMAIDKGHAGSMNNLGTYYSSIGNYDQMKKYLEMAIEKGDTNGYLNMAEYYKMNENYEQMKEYYLKAAKSGNINGYLALGAFYGKNGQNEEARDCYQQLIDQRIADGLIEMALHYANIENNYIEAIKYIKQCMSLDILFEFDIIIDSYFNQLFEDYCKNIRKEYYIMYLIKTENIDHECCICYQQSNIKTLCNHYYCSTCSDQLFIKDNKPCALCRFGESIV